MPGRVILVFLDGVGLAPACDQNPFSFASMPFFHDLLGSAVVFGAGVVRPDLFFDGIDACLGVEGIPQSATGQTALLTGVNAAKLLGYHLPAFPGQRLIETIQTESLLLKAGQRGRSATFANAYTPGYFDLVRQGKRMHSVTTHCVLAAKLPFRTLDDLKAGNAVYWDMTNEHVPPGNDISLITPVQAGYNLARLSSSCDLVLYENFLPDLLGHGAEREGAAGLLSAIDRFMAGVFDAIDSSTTLIMTSDHGNIEDLSTSGHTTNPVPLLAAGPGAPHFSGIDSITQVTPTILDILAGTS